MELLLLYVGLALAGSFLCSILEAALLSATPSELADRKERGDRGAARLLWIKQERIDDAIAAILTLNTMANTVGAVLAGVQASIVFGDRWLGAFSGALTLAILVGSEIVPKTLGAVHASRLVGFVARTVRVLMWLLAPVLVLTRGLTRLLWRGEPRRVSRGEIAALVAAASSQGAIRADESRLLANALRFEGVKVLDIMTPRIVVVMLPAGATVRELLDDPRAGAFSRIPLFEASGDRVVGYVLQREVLAEAARQGRLDRPLADLLRPILVVPETMSVAAALRRFLDRREHIAIVADEFGAVVGVVTMEDVLETLLGHEIIDELDRVADLRVAAADLRDRRLARVREERQLGDARPDPTDEPPPSP
jgi:CBS domain containing-hemolysin-like protein